MTALGNIWGQVLARRRMGWRSVAAGMALTPLWQLYKRTVGRPVTVRTWRGPRFVLERDCVTSSRFVYEGRPDQGLIDTLAAFAGDGAALVDVGANVGLYAVLLGGDFARGWAFEPNPVAAARLRRNLVLNEAQDRFEVVEAAVGEVPGRMAFPALDRPDPAAALGTVAGRREITVPVVTLDAALPPDGAYVVKIDAEGWDAQVLRGAAGHLEAGRIRLALFECNATPVLDDVLALAGATGYTVHAGLRPIEAAGAPPARNLFLVRNDLIARYLDAASRFGEAGS